MFLFKIQYLSNKSGTYYKVIFIDKILKIKFQTIQSEIKNNCNMQLFLKVLNL